jgi:hypothetical protein
MECKTIEEWNILLREKIVSLYVELRQLHRDPIRNKHKMHQIEQTIKQYSNYITQK